MRSGVPQTSGTGTLGAYTGPDRMSWSLDEPSRALASQAPRQSCGQSPASGRPQRGQTAHVPQKKAQCNRGDRGSQYASRLRALAAYAERTGPPHPAAALAGLVAERAQGRATASALRGIISAIRAVEDLQWLPPAVTPVPKRTAAGAASSGLQPYLSLAGMVHLVERAKNSRYGTVFGALAILSWVCFLCVGETAGIRVSDLAIAGFVQFWNSKTADEGYTTRPLCRYADGVRAWLHRHMVSLGRSSDMLVWQSGEAGLEPCMAETLAGTAYAHARWHALRRGGAAASWARKPELTYYKCWGRWQSTAVAM